jgi:DNA repair exonuclease SbcCD ATPase subunit
MTLGNRLNGIAFWSVAAVTALLLTMLAYRTVDLETYADNQKQVIAKISVELKTKQNALERINLALTKRERDLKMLQDKLEQTQQMISLLSLENAASDDAYMQIRSKLSIQIRQLNSQIGNFKLQLQQDSDTVGDLNARISKLNERVETLEKTRSDLCTAVQDADRRIHSPPNGRADSKTKTYIAQMAGICGKT